MEEKLKDILSDYESNIERYENQVNELRDTYKYCNKHKFEEETRMARIKLDQIEMVVYNYRKMYDEIKEVAEMWNS